MSYKMALFVQLLTIFLISCQISNVIGDNDEEISSDRYVIEGKVFPPENTVLNGWQLITHVMANGGEHYGYLR